MDGIFHLDSYHLEIDAENSLPRSPNYPIDDEFNQTRFSSDIYPWIMRYLDEQYDGKFWTQNSVLSYPERLTIPVFIIGSILDFYRY
jgi:hypothetical protein